MEHSILTAMDGSEHKVGVYSGSHPMGRYQGKNFVVPYYDENILDVVAADLRGYISHGATCNILITGKVRTGKSTLAQKIARRLDLDFPLDNVVFWPEDYTKAIQTLPYADHRKQEFPQVIWDESILGLMNRKWYSEVSMNIIETNEVCAKKGIIQYFVIPHRAKLDVAVRDEMVHLWIHCFISSKLRRGYAEVRSPSENIFENDVFWKPEYAFRFKPFPPNDPFWMAYEEKKKVVIDRVVSGAHRIKTQGSPRAARWKSQRDALVCALYDYSREHGDKPLRQIDIAKIIESDNALVHQILATKNDTPNPKSSID